MNAAAQQTTAECKNFMAAYLWQYLISTIGSQTNTHLPLEEED